MNDAYYLGFSLMFAGLAGVAVLFNSDGPPTAGPLPLIFGSVSVVFLIAFIARIAVGV